MLSTSAMTGSAGSNGRAWRKEASSLVGSEQTILRKLMGFVAVASAKRGRSPRARLSMDRGTDAR
ncbi:hypothetical protein BE08_43755 [Sorangium cellulosum]|uniref:Uncharacterized protein n=1 Tax=Sorangium cellulosum TaxID=56 RepID=A0A150PTT2_SORCE|nr:hypothetical protein BE08_43755 [Sorangium cellulosum]